MKVESKKIIFGRYNYSNLYGNTDSNAGYTNMYLQLKPLSSISDKDAKLVGYASLEAFLALYDLYSLYAKQLDSLRQLGYATDQTVIEDGKVVTYTVEQLVNEGLFKLD